MPFVRRFDTRVEEMGVAFSVAWNVTVRLSLLIYYGSEVVEKKQLAVIK